MQVHDKVEDARWKRCQEGEERQRKLKGWSEEGKAFMVKMTKDIKSDINSGAHGEWEKMCKKVCAAAKAPDEQEQEVGGNAEVGHSALHSEVQLQNSSVSQSNDIFEQVDSVG